MSSRLYFDTQLVTPIDKGGMTGEAGKDLLGRIISNYKHITQPFIHGEKILNHSESYWFW